MSSTIPGLRSPADPVGGVVYFGRMLDKIRLHLKKELPAEYIENLGEGFDERCVHFLKVSYAKLTDQVAENPGASDDELFNWAMSEGRHPEEEDIEIWSEFMRKRGWNDEVSERLAQRKQELGVSGRDDIQTMFQFIDADEGRF